jgi:hypothetical protein
LNAIACDYAGSCKPRNFAVHQTLRVNCTVSDASPCDLELPSCVRNRDDNGFVHPMSLLLASLSRSVGVVSFDFLLKAARGFLLR